jgi:DNA-binding IclR family transcriptional regulator
MLYRSKLDTIRAGEPMSDREAGQFYNRSLERALQILDAFNRDRRVLTRSQLAEILGLPRATVLRLCATLVQYRYLARDPDTNAYSLGMRFFEQGSILFNSFPIRAAASRYLAQLQQDTGQTVFLGVLDNDELLYIDKREDPHNVINFTSKVGTRRPPFWGMCGPCLMAYLSDDRVERLLKKTPLAIFTKNSITDVSEFKAWLGRIREDGMVIDRETTLEGISGVAAPIRDSWGGVVASLGIAMISSAIDQEGLERLARAVMASAAAISKEAGYR